jgi:type VI protein secretion system component VasK
VIRWLRIVATATVVLSMVGIGVVVGLFLVANSGWVAVDVPPWLVGLFGDPKMEVWLPGLIAGWLAVVFLTAVLLVWSLWYVWRRRQYESLIGRLERELARLRNLPFTEPAPLEDLPERPDQGAARLLAALDAETTEWDEDELRGND